MIEIFIPKELSEDSLRSYKDDLYDSSSKGECNFTGLLEYIGSRENIIHALRKIKSNHGFQTAGVDKTIGNDILQEDAETFFKNIQIMLEGYKPNDVRRVYINKRNGKKRPLGIATIYDRVIQTAIANIIEPILEGKFYEHSYGFRPMRQIEHAYGMISVLLNTGNRYYVVEGDIKGFFDNVNHKILINKLYKYGVRNNAVKKWCLKLRIWDLRLNKKSKSDTQ